MIIAAADYNFRKYTDLFLSSLIKKGHIDLGNFRYFVFDFAKRKKEYKTNCYSMVGYILKRHPFLNVTIVPFEDMQKITANFKRLYKSLKLKYFMKINLIDYLKGYFLKYTKQPYLFLDSDIIVENEIRDLYNACKKKNKLAMVASHDFQLYLYFEFYRNYTRKKLKDYYVNKGTLSTGVMFIPKDYTSLLFDIFSETIASSGVGGYSIQGAWNIIFWLKRGYILPERYNSMPSGNNKTAVMSHYPYSRRFTYSQ